LDIFGTFTSESTNYAQYLRFWSCLRSFNQYMPGLKKSQIFQKNIFSIWFLFNFFSFISYNFFPIFSNFFQFFPIFFSIFSNFLINFFPFSYFQFLILDIFGPFTSESTNCAQYLRFWSCLRIFYQYMPINIPNSTRSSIIQNTRINLEVTT
jgi:hypothetical protein